jgi:Uma2 family endonuclease
MATAPTMLSLEEYLSTSFRPDADYVNGELQERNLGQFDHGRLQWFLSAYFFSREKEWHIKGSADQRIRIASSTIRVCDLVLLYEDAPREQVIETCPLLCIEIMSPDDRLGRAKEVLADYLVMGVPNIWLIDPLRRAAFTFDASGLHEADPTRLTVHGTPIHLDLTEAFAAID